MTDDDTCPHCGGTTTVLIKPGVRRCESEIVEYETIRSADHYAEQIWGQPRQRIDRVERRRVCGETYDVATPTSQAICQGGADRKPDGAFAVGLCVQCSIPVCRRHAQILADKVHCVPCFQEKRRPHVLAAMADARALREENRARAAAETAAKQAALARFEAETPGFPRRPEYSTSHPLPTVLESYGMPAGIELSELVAVLARLVPDRQADFVLTPRNGLFQPATRAVGWGFASRTAFRESDSPGPNPNFFDHVSMYLVTPDKRLWVSRRYIEKGKRLNPTDFSGSPASWQPTGGRVSWWLVERIRNTVADWLASPSSGASGGS